MVGCIVARISPKSLPMPAPMAKTGVTSPKGMSSVIHTADETNFITVNTNTATPELPNASQVAIKLSDVREPCDTSNHSPHNETKSSVQGKDGGRYVCCVRETS